MNPPHRHKESAELAKKQLVAKSLRWLTEDAAWKVNPANEGIYLACSSYKAWDQPEIRALEKAGLIQIGNGHSHHGKLERIYLKRHDSDALIAQAIEYAEARGGSEALEYEFLKQREKDTHADPASVEELRGYMQQLVPQLTWRTGFNTDYCKVVRTEPAMLSYAQKEFLEMNLGCMGLKLRIGHQQRFSDKETCEIYAFDKSAMACVRARAQAGEFAFPDYQVKEFQPPQPMSALLPARISAPAIKFDASQQGNHVTRATFGSGNVSPDDKSR